MRLTRGEASFANYLTKAWGNSDAFLAPLFGSPIAGQRRLCTVAPHVAALKALSPEASYAQATALLNNAGTVLGAALSCGGILTTSGTLLGEDSECTWAKVSDTQQGIPVPTTRDTQGFQVSQMTYRVGAQKELTPGWYLGGSFGAGPTSSSSDNGSSGQGYTLDGSVSVKHVAGPWLFAGSLAMAYGSFSNSRLVQLPFGGMATAVLNSESSLAFVAGRLRAGYEFTFPRGYIRPYADLDLVHSQASGYQERGGSIYALDVQSSSQTARSCSPMMEIGGRYDFDGSILRPFLTAGVSFNTNAARMVNARFAGAAAQDGTFQTYLNSPAVIGIFTAGLTLYQRNGTRDEGGIWFLGWRFLPGAERQPATGVSFLSIERWRWRRGASGEWVKRLRCSLCATRSHSGWRQAHRPGAMMVRRAAYRLGHVASLDLAVICPVPGLNLPRCLPPLLPLVVSRQFATVPNSGRVTIQGDECFIRGGAPIAVSFVHHARCVADVAQCGLPHLSVQPEVIERSAERVPQAVEAQAGLHQLPLDQTLHQSPKERLEVVAGVRSVLRC